MNLSPSQAIDKTYGKHLATPLRAIDHLEVHQDGDTFNIKATKMIVADDPYMAAHFPNFTIYPGVFILEGLRQAVIGALGQAGEARAEIDNIKSVQFTAPLLPGDRMVLSATGKRIAAAKRFEVTATCVRNDGAVTARLKVVFRYDQSGRTRLHSDFKVSTSRDRDAAGG